MVCLGKTGQKLNKKSFFGMVKYVCLICNFLFFRSLFFFALFKTLYLYWLYLSGMFVGYGVLYVSVNWLTYLYTVNIILKAIFRPVTALKYNFGILVLLKA